jgi:mRNA interferase HigB
MHVLSYSTLREFAARHRDAKEPLDAWYGIVKRARYETPKDVKEDFGSASFLNRNRVVFNIGGNKYRLVVKMEYQRSEVYVRHVVTHQDYDELTRANEL